MNNSDDDINTSFKNNIYMISDRKLDIQDKSRKTEETGVVIEKADFETAISATKFGKFNLILLLLAIPSGWSSLFETTTMSYVFPAAQCDLDLSLDNKGMLNAITYTGMVSSAFLWGFLVDTLGRKKLLILGFSLDFCFVFISSLSQNFNMLMVSKFFGGFIINGPFAALTSYLSEFHCARYRARVLLIMGIIFSCANLVLPLGAWAIFPLNLNFTLFNGYMEFHSWNVYLLLCSLPSLVSSLGMMLMPESPKFLMMVGRNDEALLIFQKVYSINTGKAPGSFPVKTLIDETALHENDLNSHGGHVTANRTKIQALKEGFQQIQPLFYPPHLSKIVLVCTIQIAFFYGLNTLRLWLPQIFTAINDYEYLHGGQSAGLCEMLQMVHPNKTDANATDTICVVNLLNSAVYFNSMIVGCVSIMGYVIAGTLINALGKKQLLICLATVAGSSAIGIYFAQNTETTVALSSMFVSLSSISVNVILTVVVDLFPTSLRTLTVSLVMMCGRLGAVIGNSIFPFLLSTGCLPPFFAIGFCTLSCAFLSFLLPKTDLKALE